MPKKQKVRAAVRKLKEDVGSRIPTDADGRSAYRAVGENGDEDTEDYYADTPGGRDYNGEQSSASQGYGKAGGSGSGGMRTRNDGDGQDGEAVVMDTSLAAPVQLPFGTRAFERVIADPSLAGVDFVIDEPARARATPTEGAVRTGGYSREQHRRDDDDDMTVHEPAQKWGDTEADGEAEAENDGEPFYDEHGDGIELLKLRAPSSSSSGANGHGGHHGLTGGKITNTRAFIHILKSYIGSGVLGLPYAYAQGGMLAAMAGMLTVSVMSTLCVFLLLDCKRKLTGRVRTFGDVGYGALGRTGHILVELTVVLSQLGFSCAYLIFVSQNLFLYLKVALTSEASIVWALVPVLVALSWIPSLDVLAPFSVLALALIFSGLGAVAWHAAPLIGSGPDVQTYIPSTLPIFIGMAIYAFEGIGLALPIQNQMKHPESFKTVWAWGMIVVTSTYIVFGAFCYSCYGDEVPSIITMVLPNNVTSLLVKFGLSIALIFTYPIAMFPVFEIVEDSWAPSLFKSPSPLPLPGGPQSEDIHNLPGAVAALWRRRAARFVLVLITAVAAVSIPDFSIVMAFIGSVPSNIMAFLLPSLFHLVICWRVMGFWGRLLDILLLLSAIGAVTVCTWTTVFGLINHLEIPG